MLTAFSIGTNSCVPCPIQTPRRRAVFRSGSVDSSSPAPSKDARHLTAFELAGADFDAAYHNQPPLTVNDHRTHAVATLQTLLAERFGLREMMPQTFSSGGADGQWSAETTRAVRSFQESHGVWPVGGWEGGT